MQPIEDVKLYVMSVSANTDTTWRSLINGDEALATMSICSHWNCCCNGLSVNSKISLLLLLFSLLALTAYTNVGGWCSELKYLHVELMNAMLVGVWYVDNFFTFDCQALDGGHAHSPFSGKTVQQNTGDQGIYIAIKTFENSNMSNTSAILSYPATTIPLLQSWLVKMQYQYWLRYFWCHIQNCYELSSLLSLSQSWSIQIALSREFGFMMAMLNIRKADILHYF